MDFDQFIQTCGATVQFDLRANPSTATLILKEHIITRTYPSHSDYRYVKHKLLSLLLRDAAFLSVDALKAYQRISKVPVMMFKGKFLLTEDFKTEFKGPQKDIPFQSTQQMKNVMDATVETVGGFLNTDGGSIYIGIKDDGTVIGVYSKDLDQILLWVQDKIFSVMDPRDENCICVIPHTVGKFHIPEPSTLTPGTLCEYAISLEEVLHGIESQVSCLVSSSTDSIYVIEVMVKKASSLTMISGRFYQRVGTQTKTMTRQEIVTRILNETK